jgi:hypothetical protein
MPSSACLGFAFTVHSQTDDNFLEWNGVTNTLNVSPTDLTNVQQYLVSFKYGTTANPQLGYVDV